MYIDIFLVVFVLIGVIQGFHRGLIRSVFAVLGTIIGFLAALKFAPYVVTFFESVFRLDPLFALILGLVVTFLALMLGIRWLGKSFENTLKLAKVNFINKLLGATLFAILMIVVYSAVIWFLARADLLSSEQKSQSYSYPFLQEVPAKTGAMIEKMKPVFKEFWEKMDAALTPSKSTGEIQEQ